MGNERGGSVVGIDLGTTLSVVSRLDPSGVLTTITNRNGEPLTPSAVYLEGKTAVVGKGALEAAGDWPDKVATVIKRDMGLPVYGRKVDGAEFRPETLSAIILRKLKQDAERRIGPICAAVITVPAFFDDIRRKATEDAGKIAGLEVLDIINEPTAAAIAYTFEGWLDVTGAAASRYFPGGEQLDQRLKDLFKGVEVVNVNAHSLGIQAKYRGADKRVNAILIPKDSPLPGAKSRVLLLGEAGRTELKIKVLEGDAEEASDCVTIGECFVSDLPPNLTADSPVQVQLRFERNGRLSVAALEPTSGVVAKAEIRRQGGLTDEDIRKECDFVQSLSIQ